MCQTKADILKKKETEAHQQSDLLKDKLEEVQSLRIALEVNSLKNLLMSTRMHAHNAIMIM